MILLLSLSFLQYLPFTIHIVNQSPKFVNSFFEKISIYSKKILITTTAYTICSILAVPIFSKKIQKITYATQIQQINCQNSPTQDKVLSCVGTIQHRLNRNSVPARRIVHEHMRNRADNIIILNDRASAHPLNNAANS